MKLISKPTSGVPDFYQHYIDVVPDDGQLLRHLSNILSETEALISTLTEEKLMYRYAPINGV